MSSQEKNALMDQLESGIDVNAVNGEGFEKTQKLLGMLDEAVERLDLDEEGKRLIEFAKRIAIAFHVEDVRASGEPYLNHVLNVALRVLVDFKEKDPNVIAAALIHDVVEDHEAEVTMQVGPSKTGSDRRRSLAATWVTLNIRISRLVNLLSKEPTNVNEELSALEAEEVKISSYLTYVEKVASSPQAFMIKVADLMDNALNLSSVKDHKWRFWLSRKYLPVLQFVSNRLMEEDITIDQDIKNNINSQFLSAATEAQEFIDTYEE